MKERMSAKGGRLRGPRSRSLLGLSAVALAACSAEIAGPTAALDEDPGAPLDAGSRIPSTTDAAPVVGARDAGSPDLAPDAGPDVAPDAASTYPDRPGPVDLPPVDPGEYADVNPVATMGPLEQIGSDTIVHHIQRLEWHEDYQQLQAIYIEGGRNMTADPYPFSTGEDDAELKEWTSRLITADGDMRLLRQYPGKDNQGSSWCWEWSGDARIICNAFPTKNQSTIRWLESGDGINAPLVWTTVATEFVGEQEGFAGHIKGRRVNGFIRRSDGTIYMTMTSKKRASWILRVAPDDTGAVEHAFSDDPAQADFMDHAAFLAWSVNEDYLYFTELAVGGDRDGPRAGNVWFARVGPDGALDDPQLLTSEPIQGIYDLEFDAAGNLYVAAGDKVSVYSAEGGHLGDIEGFEPDDKAQVTALAFGGPEGDQLFVAIGLGSFNGFGALDWPNRREYRRGKLFRLQAPIPGAWRRR